MEQFTFYELYADILQGMDDASAGKFAKRICEYEFENKEPLDGMTEKESFYWSNIEDMLKEVKEVESTGKNPKKYNLRSEHFTFYNTYYKAMKLLNDRQSGMFVKAICEYMFKGEAPVFKDKSMQSYFNLCKRKMDLSKQRKSSGTAGGSARKKSQVKAEPQAVHAEKTNITLDYDEFRRAYPDIQGDLYGLAERYKTALDWAEVAAKVEMDIDLQNETNIYRLTQKYVQRYGERR